jgi:hypothetical protein
MIAERALDSIVYARPQQPDSQSPSHMLAATSIRTLSYLSFIISQFGGVTSMGTSDEPGFTELRKVFYTAVDILCSAEDLDLPATQENGCEAFTRELVNQLLSFEGNITIYVAFAHLKDTF